VSLSFAAGLPGRGGAVSPSRKKGETSRSSWAEGGAGTLGIKADGLNAKTEQGKGKRWEEEEKGGGGMSGGDGT